jgi:peptide-methionine (S)-S-oxide reductase
VYSSPIVTKLEPLEAFYPAEEYHQDFVRKHPEHPYVRRWSVPKLQKVATSLADIAKK